MNYISNSTAMCCCGFNDREKIEVSEMAVMIDCETGDEVKLSYSFIPGHTYRCEKRWALMKDYTILDTFVTKEQALAAYKKIVNCLRDSKDDRVIDI